MRSGRCQTGGITRKFALMGLNEHDKLSHMESEGKGLIQNFLRHISRRYGVWIVAGTIPMESALVNKIRASTLVFNHHGERVGRYDKIHLFDVDVPDSDETISRIRYH